MSETLTEALAVIAEATKAKEAALAAGDVAAYKAAVAAYEDAALVVATEWGLKVV